MTPSSEPRLRFDKRDQFINILPFAAARTLTVTEPQATSLDNVLDTRVFLIAAAPADFAGVARMKSITFAQEGQIDAEVVLALIDQKAIAARPA